MTSATTFGQWWADGTYESDGTTAGKHAVGILELGPVSRRAEPVPVLERAAQRVGRLFPDRSAADQLSPIYTADGQRRPVRARVRTSRGCLERAVALQPLAILVQLDDVRCGRGCKAAQYVIRARLRARDHR